VRVLSFDVQRGKALSPLAPKGAGRTTTVSMLAGLIKPSQGDAESKGYSIVSDGVASQRLIGVVSPRAHKQDVLDDRPPGFDRLADGWLSQSAAARAGYVIGALPGYGSLFLVLGLWRWRFE